MIAAHAQTGRAEGCDFLRNSGDVVSGRLLQPGHAPLEVRVPRNYLPEELPVRNGTLGADGSILVQMYIDTLQPYVRSREDRYTAPFATSFSALFGRGGNAKATLLAYQNVYFAKNRRIDGPVETSEASFPFGISSKEFDLLVFPNPSEPTDVLLCSKFDASRGISNPLCRHKTSVAGTDVKLVYSRRYLADWQKLRRQVSLFLSCVIAR